MPTTRGFLDDHSENVAVLGLMERMNVADSMPTMQAVAGLVVQGLVTLTDGQWRLTAAGWAALANREVRSIH